jgi:hypothetical protein
MADHSKVNIDALAAFGKALAFGDHGMIQDYGDGLNKGANKIGNAVVGFSGTNEAQVFRDYYYQVVLYSAGKFNEDVAKGLMSMSYGAIVEAANYREGDLSQAEALHDVEAAFDPAPGTPSVATDMAAAAAKKQAEDARMARLRHQTGEDRLPPPSSDTPATTCPLPSPMEQVREHNDLYGKDERWQPKDPNAQPDVQIIDPPPPGGWPDTYPATEV